MTSSISDFYEGKNIIVFGSITFPGKVLIEKLLRSCPNIDNIYCPIPILTKKSNPNTNHHFSPIDIFAEIYTTKLFDRVRRNNAKFQEKIIPFDINLLYSSLDDGNNVEQDNEQKQTEILSYKNIQNTVDICFYMANNSIDFEEQNLKEMIQTNVIDLKRILTFLKTCTKLKSIVYLSSIYANIGK
ncbi:unnamed protein product [Rotaria sp. Silwood2]|nr:unnamed protein product [Rotaria sp. Silwood2]CAF4569514.1 unnamed protein product [Rotaria sp. Silwood2]CAF4649757.1 unnamed protein product [Rotaria sp. Silwood2]